MCNPRSVHGIELSDAERRDLIRFLHLGTRLTFRDLVVDDTGLYGLYPVESVGILI